MVACLYSLIACRGSSTIYLISYGPSTIDYRPSTMDHRPISKSSNLQIFKSPIPSAQHRNKTKIIKSFFTGTAILIFGNAQHTLVLVFIHRYHHLSAWL